MGQTGPYIVAGGVCWAVEVPKGGQLWTCQRHADVGW